MKASGSLVAREEGFWLSCIKYSARAFLASKNYSAAAARCPTPAGNAPSKTQSNFRTAREGGLVTLREAAR